MKNKIESYAVTNGSFPNTGNVQAGVLGFKASIRSYALNPTAPANLLFCSDTPNSVSKMYAVIAVSQSGKAFYVSNSVSVSPLPTSYNTSTPAANCTDLNTGLTALYGGYASGDLVTGPWRSWTGVTN